MYPRRLIIAVAFFQSLELQAKAQGRKSFHEDFALVIGKRGEIQGALGKDERKTLAGQGFFAATAQDGRPSLVLGRRVGCPRVTDLNARGQINLGSAGLVLFTVSTATANAIIVAIGSPRGCCRIVGSSCGILVVVNFTPSQCFAIGQQEYLAILGLAPATAIVLEHDKATNAHARAKAPHDKVGRIATPFGGFEIGHLDILDGVVIGDTIDVIVDIHTGILKRRAASRSLLVRVHFDLDLRCRVHAGPVRLFRFLVP